MIHLERRIATYVYQCNGIYYFQIRLKKDDSRRQKYKSGLIRKSLKTRDYREAVFKARLLWYKYMINAEMHEKQNYEKILATQTEIEEYAERCKVLYARGKQLAAIYEAIPDKNDERFIDDFFDHEFGNAEFSPHFDREAFVYYTDMQVKQSVESISCDAEIHKPSETQEPLIDKIWEHVSDRSKIAKNKSTSIKLSEAANLFIERRKVSKDNWSEGTLAKYQSNIDFFVMQMNDCSLYELSKDKIIDCYINVLHQYPINAKKIAILKDRSGKLFDTERILMLTKKNSLATMSARTLQSKATQVKAFIKSLNLDKYIIAELIDAFESIDRLSVKNKRRKGFSDQDLQKLFHQPEYLSGRWHRRYQFRHWVPLVALYTGARVNEICQLLTCDIKRDEETGIYYFHFTDTPDEEDQFDGGKSLKTENAKRVVPIHENLKKLGFLDFVKCQKQLKRSRLFHELTFNKNEKWARKVKRWFNGSTEDIGFMEAAGVKKFVSDDYTSMSFHCFRSTVINFEKQNGLNKDIFCELVGHAVKDPMHDNYSEAYYLKTLQREINKLRYDLDISKIKKWS